ncbi:M28 family metallopeptidase [Beduini massiliensis]|uniref:M28 family metallopeptidase n=1 Tax=Beduini massiliensis TaxID=1585974 RepID=UPI00059A8475|nr:M28 family peptidase [Beduini massiliensis]
MINGNREFDLLKKIGFIRTSGSKEELQAAQILLNEIKAIGLEGKLDAFPVRNDIIEEAVLEVTEPYQKSYRVTGFTCSGNLEETIAEFKYVEDLNDIDLHDVKGKVILMNTRPGIKNFEKIVKSEALAFITFQGTIKDTLEESDLEERKLRESVKKYGCLPGFNILARDAQEIVLKKASKVKVKLIQTKKEWTSHNVMVSIPGSEYPDEEINFCGHYDSVPFSTGVYDNGAGSVIIMEILRYFKENPPKRTMNFLWFGSEEVGLEGSKYYIQKYADTLDKSILTINVDVAGCVLGKDLAMVTADESLCHYIEHLAKEIDFSLNVKQQVYSSDSTPFANAGVPAVSFARFGAEGGAFIHCRYDLIDWLSSDSLAHTTEFVLTFADRIDKAKINPIVRKMPENMVKDIHQYLDIKTEEK